MSSALEGMFAVLQQIDEHLFQHLSIGEEIGLPRFDIGQKGESMLSSSL